MIAGSVSQEGVPTISLPVAGRDWIAVVDTGFNGVLELPQSLRQFLAPLHVFRSEPAPQLLVQTPSEFRS